MIGLRSLIGKPWALPSQPPASFDCWTLVCHVRGLLGLYTPTHSDIRVDELGEDREIIHRPPTGWQQLDEPELWCVTRLGPRHVGVYLGQDSVMHAQAGSGVRTDRLTRLRQMLPVTFWEWTDA